MVFLKNMGSQERRDELKKEHLQSCKDYTCSICLCLYNKPVMLKKCQHIYCMDCFKNLFTTLKSPKTILCPICKRPTTRREYTAVNLEFQTKVENLRIYQSIIDSWDGECSDNKSKCKSANRKSYKSRLVHDISALSSDDTDTSLNNEAPPAIEAIKPAAAKSLKFSSPTTITIKKCSPTTMKNRLIRKTKSLNCVITKRSPIKRKARNRTRSHDTDELFIDDKYDSNIITSVDNSETISNTQVINVLENCLNNYENKAAATDINKLIEEEILKNIENDMEISNDNNNKENESSSSSGWKRMKTTISKCLNQDRSSYQKLNLTASKNKKRKRMQNTTDKKQNKKRSTSSKKIIKKNDVEPNAVFALHDFEIFSSNHLEQNTDMKPNRIKHDELNLNALMQDNENDEDEIFSLATQKVAEKTIIHNKITIGKNQKPHLDEITIYTSPKVQTKQQIWNPTHYVSTSPDILIHKDLNGDELQKKHGVLINVEPSEETSPPLTAKSNLDTDDDLIISGTESSHIDEHNNKLPQVLNEMKCTSEKRTEMLSKFQSCLNSHDLLISQVSKYISSSDTNVSIKECFHSMPNLQASFENKPVFSNTVIPYLKNIRRYFDRIHFMATEMNTEMKHIANQFETETTESIESYLLNECNAMVQTDDLNCPNCDYSFKLNNNCNIQHSSRIRPVPKISSDDSNSTLSKKANSSKYHSQFLYRHDLEVVFESDMSEGTSSNQTQNNNNNQTEYINKLNLSSEKSDITSNYISILEREYKNRKCPEQCDEQNTEIDHLLSDIHLSEFNSNKEEQHSLSLFTETKQETAIRSETDSSNIIAATLFTNHPSLADILAKNQDCNDDVELDNEVANLTNHIIEDSLGSEKDIFEEDVIVESTPQKLPMLFKKISLKEAINNNRNHCSETRPLRSSVDNLMNCHLTLDIWERISLINYCCNIQATTMCYTEKDSNHCLETRPLRSSVDNLMNCHLTLDIWERISLINYCCNIQATTMCYTEKDSLKKAISNNRNHCSETRPLRSSVDNLMNCHLTLDIWERISLINYCCNIQATTMCYTEKDSARDESVIKNPIVELIEPPSTVQDATVDWLCTLPPPPPPGFEDFEDNTSSAKPEDITFIEPHVLAKINEQNESKENVQVLMTSRSDEKCSKQNLNPIVLAQKEKFSPLQVKVNTKVESKPTMLVTPKQKSILNYVSNKAASRKSCTESELLIESCHSPANEISHHSTTIKTEVSKSRNIVIACSRLNKDETMSILRMTSQLNVKYSRDFSKSVTHVVVTVDDRNRVKDHTIKYVLAISHSLWILSFAWVKDSLAHDRLMPEEMYEVLDVTGIPGPKLSRLTRETHPLFQNYVIYCADSFVSLGRQDLESAIISLGGEIVRSPNQLLKENNKICLILSEAKVTQDFDQYQMWRDTFNILVVDVEWLSRSVGQFQIASVRPFILCLEDDIEKLGYPYQLIAPVVGTPSQL